MKQISIISAKGGAGKTFITAAFATMADRLILVDSDTESNDLRLMLEVQADDLQEVETNARVQIDEDECIRCGLCKALCHFDAVRNDFGVYKIEKEHCQSCDLCLKACPVSAIKPLESTSNKWGIAESKFGPLLYAQLALGEELNGKLISIIRDRAKEMAQEQNKDLILIDGPPAVGYAVVSSFIGADLAIVVVEPGPGAIHDLHKASQLTKRYNVPMACIVNKSNLNPQLTNEILNYCKENKIPVFGEIPFEMAVMQANMQSVMLSEIAGGSEVLKKVEEIWNKVKAY